LTPSQEEVMRTFAAVSIAVMIASPARASEKQYFSDSVSYACIGAERAAGSYITALSSANNGVVESALAHVAMITLTMPGCAMRPVKATVAAIERNGATSEVRYKAWVVRTLMEKPELFAGVAKAGYVEPDALFGALAGRLAEHYAAN
jgi:hypothetical protein